MTMNDRPAQEPRRSIISRECAYGHHGYQCSRNPHRMPSWPLLAVCECPCHDDGTYSEPPEPESEAS